MNILKDIVDFIFPRFCITCEDRLSTQEQYLCLSCLAKLPRTNLHLQKENRMEQLFWVRLPIENAVSFFFYDAENVRKIIWDFKYNSQPKVATYLGELYAHEIASSGFFDGIDCIIPIPLATLRYLKRGYNQSEEIAKGINKETGIPIIKDAVKRTKNNITQTHLDKQERQENVEGIFKLCKPEKIRGKHILIIDDVITTGATVCSLGKTLMQAGDIKISVLSLALAGQLKGLPVSATKE